jgi:hypothetical protein
METQLPSYLPLPYAWQLIHSILHLSLAYILLHDGLYSDVHWETIESN